MIVIKAITAVKQQKYESKIVILRLTVCFI